MDVFIDSLGVIGMWSLFTFPLYQAFLELSTQAIDFSKRANATIQLKKVTPLYWILPPLKIYKEKRRALTIIRTINLTEDELKKMLVYFDKATAWFYVSLAGLFNSIYFSYDLYQKQTIITSTYFFLVSNLPN